MPQDRRDRREEKKKYYEENKEQIKEQSKKYREENKEYNKTYQKENPFICKKASWTHLGIKLRPGEDWESVYLFYITCELCENCECVLTDEKFTTSTRRNLDHDHETGFIRNVLCSACNTRRG